MRDRPWDLKPAEGVRKPLVAEAKPVELPILLIPAEVVLPHVKLVSMSSSNGEPTIRILTPTAVE